MVGRRDNPRGPSGTPNEMPEVSPPRDIYPTSDIRMVMIELGKHDVRLQGAEDAIARLVLAVEKATDKLEAAIKEQASSIKDDVKDVKGDVDEIKSDVSYAKGAIKALSIIGPLLILILSAVAAALARKWIG